VAAARVPAPGPAARDPPATLQVRPRADPATPATARSPAGTTRSAGTISHRFRRPDRRTDVTLVEYSSGTLWKWSNLYWPIIGTSNQLFSDRRTGDQPFNINAADTLTIYINPTGQLYIHDAPWNYNTSWDMGCIGGNTFTRIVPGLGVVTLTLRAFHPPVG
jgi:hypothetical protein